MSQNRSSAVMAQRREPPDSMDFFPTPPFATRALCERLARFRPLDKLTVREPAAGRGDMAKVLEEHFAEVEAADAFDYGVGIPVQDYLFGPLPNSVGWTVTNPPFLLAEQFIQRAVATSLFGAAMLVRTSFLESEGRYKRLFARTPPSHILQFVERVVMLKGRLVRAGDDDWANIDPYKGKPRKASTATSYCWLVYHHASRGTSFEWIPPCRKRLEREGDYDAVHSRDEA